jgi:hypothetical protein
VAFRVFALTSEVERRVLAGYGEISGILKVCLWFMAMDADELSPPVHVCSGPSVRSHGLPCARPVPRSRHPRPTEFSLAVVPPSSRPNSLRRTRELLCSSTRIRRLSSTCIHIALPEGYSPVRSSWMTSLRPCELPFSAQPLGFVHSSRCRDLVAVDLKL